jgi:ribose/xylose/arabinose/galactoside ABC-type transport system permease subunit
MLMAALVVQIVLWTVLSAIDTKTGQWHWPTFIRWYTAKSIGGAIAVNLILSVGMTFVIIGGGIDLSVGRLIALTSVVLVLVANATGSFAAGLAAGLATGAAAGFFNGFVSVRFGVPSFVTTLGTMILARGLALAVAGGQSIGSAFTPATVLQQFLPMTVSLAVMVAGHVLLVRTVFGRHVFAVGGNLETARLCGVRVMRVRILTFVLSGLCAGLAGLVQWLRLPYGDPLVGDGYELYAIAAVVIGGTSLSGGRGNVVGTFLGALIMGVLKYGLDSVSVPERWQFVIIGLVLIATVLADRLKRTSE